MGFLGKFYFEVFLAKNEMGGKWGFPMHGTYIAFSAGSYSSIKT